MLQQLVDAPKEVFNFLVAVVMNILFLVLTPLVLWPLGKTTLVFGLAKGYVVFWVAATILTAVLSVVQNRLRWNERSHVDAFVVSNLAASGLLILGWTAFAALAVGGFTAGASVWVAGVLHVIGFLSCLVAFWITGIHFTGTLYGIVNLALTLIAFLLFAALPAVARLLFGWFFNLFS